MENQSDFELIVRFNVQIENILESKSLTIQFVGPTRLSLKYNDGLALVFPRRVKPLGLNLISKNPFIHFGKLVFQQLLL